MGRSRATREGHRVRRTRRELHERFVCINRETPQFCGSAEKVREGTSEAVATTEPELFDVDGTHFAGGTVSDGNSRTQELMDSHISVGACNDGQEERADFVQVRHGNASTSNVSEELLADQVYAETGDVSYYEYDEGTSSSPRGAEIDAAPGATDDRRAFESEGLGASGVNLGTSVGTDTARMVAESCESRAGVLVKWQSLLAVLLCSGTVRMTVCHYETLRDTLRWQSSLLRGNQEALPGIRKMQISLMPLLRDFSYARSALREFRKRSGGIERVRVVLPSEWAVLDTSTGPLFDAMYARSSCETNSNAGPRFVFEDIENVPIVSDRWRVTDSSQYIFVDAAQEAGRTKHGKLPVTAGPGDLIQVLFSSCSKADRVVRAGTGDGVEASDSSRSLTCRVRSIWNLGGNDSARSTGREGQSFCLFSECRSMNPGDTVVELCLEEGEQCTDHLCILLYRFRRNVLGETTKQIYFIPRDGIENGALDSNKCTVCSVNCVRYISGSTDALHSKRHAPCTGYLKDGRRYVVYRALLYCDDFQPYSSTNDSYGGCYMLPMGLPPMQRSGYGAVRCIGLTPPKVSTNEVLQYIISDLVKCCTSGVEGRDPSGNPVTIFIDVLGFIGDYPAVSHALDVLGHNSRAPCHLCSFVRQDRIGHGALSYYGYTTQIHSKATAFCRSLSRMKCLRAEDNNGQDLAKLGFQPRFEMSDYPLHALSEALCAARIRVPRTDREEPVVPATFNPYRSCLVAPDHLLFGLAQDVLRATVSIFNPRTRRIVDFLLKGSLSSNNLGKHRQIINPASASINSMGMSDLFCVLLAAPICFDTAMRLDQSSGELSIQSAGSSRDFSETPAKKQRVSRKVGLSLRASRIDRGPSSACGSVSGSVKGCDMLELLSMFQRLVRETHFWPCAVLDGAACMKEFNDGNGGTHLDTLFGLAVEYIDRLHLLCLRDASIVGKHLNKPNVHRLLELYTHTIPAFGHCKHVQELLFETAHQPLKRAIARSNQRDPHLSAVTAVLANDWESRLSIEVNSLGSPETWDAEACTRLRRLVAGRELADTGDVRKVRSAFCAPVLSQLRKVRRTLSSRTAEHAVWTLHFDGEKTAHSWESWRGLGSDHRGTLMIAVERIKKSTDSMGFEPESIRIGDYACSWHAIIPEDDGPAVPVSRRQFGDIYPGSVVQALTADNGDAGRSSGEVSELQTPLFNSDPHSDSFRLSFWVVIGMFEARKLRPPASSGAAGEVALLPYALVLPCVRSTSESKNVPVRADTTGKAYVLPLSQSVRETMCMHACADAGCIVQENDCVHHSGLIGSGTPFYVLGRRDGYPPRIG